MTPDVACNNDCWFVGGRKSGIGGRAFWNDYNMRNPTTTGENCVYITKWKQCGI